MQLLSGFKDRTGNYVDPRLFDAEGKPLADAPIHHASGPTSFVFALDSDLSSVGKNEVDRLAEMCEDVHLISGICIVGRGLFGPTQRVVYDLPTQKYFTFNAEPLNNKLREIVSGDDDHTEVLTLIANLHNLILEVAAGRGQPPLSAYLLSQ